MKPATNTSAAARTLSLIVATILALLPFHALLSTWAISNFGHAHLLKSWKELVIVASLPLALWLVAKDSQLRSWLVKSWLIRLMILFGLLNFGLGLYALHDGDVNKTALAYGLLINLRYFGFFIVCLVATKHSNLLAKSWHKLLLLPAAAVVLFGLAQHFLLSPNWLRHFGYGPTTIQPYQTVDANNQYVRIQSTLRGANPLGTYLVVAIPGLITVLNKRRKLLGISLVATFTALFYSYSRSAWIGAGLAIGVLVWLPAGIRAKRWLLLVSALAVVGLGSIYAFRSNQTVQDVFLHTSTNSASAKSSNMIRDAAIKGGLHDVIHQPLGRGTGTARPASFYNKHTPRIAENYYLQIGQEVGVAGLAIFLAIIIMVGRQLWQRKDDPLARVLLASLVGISFVNLVSHAWTDDTLSLLWWGLAGIALAPILRAKAQQNVKTQQKPA